MLSHGIITHSHFPPDTCNEKYPEMLYFYAGGALKGSGVFFLLGISDLVLDEKLTLRYFFFFSQERFMVLATSMELVF